MTRVGTCQAPAARAADEKPPESPARGAELEPAGPGRTPRRLAPDDQRHRGRTLRPVAPARDQDREALRPAGGNDFRRGGVAMPAQPLTPSQKRYRMRGTIMSLVAAALLIAFFFAMDP